METKKYKKVKQVQDDIDPEALLTIKEPLIYNEYVNLYTNCEESLLDTAIIEDRLLEM